MTSGIGFAEFEQFVADTFRQLPRDATDLDVEQHEVIEGTDGTYDFDATIRFSTAGLSFLVLVEAKYHQHPIKRDVVHVLASKMARVGAHKGVIVTTATFQSGAVVAAEAAGIALVRVIEGRFTYQLRSELPTPLPTREEARLVGLPDLVAVHDGLLPSGQAEQRLLADTSRELLRIITETSGPRPPEPHGSRLP